MQVIFYGVLADEELFCVYFVLKALSDMLNDLHLVAGEERLFTSCKPCMSLGVLQRASIILMVLHRPSGIADSLVSTGEPTAQTPQSRGQG